MSALPSLLPMSHSASYHNGQRGPDPSFATHYYLQHLTLARPPTAYTSRRRSLADGHTRDGTYVNASMSSGTSGSSRTSDLKTNLPLQSYQFGAQAERGLMDKFPSRHSGRASRSNDTSVRAEMIENRSAVIRYVNQDNQDNEPKEKDHAIQILLWLSFLDPFHSTFSCIFSIITLLSLILFSPFRLCRKGDSFSITLIRIIAPIFRNHLQMIHAPSVKKAHTFDFNPTTLILIHIAAPFVSLGLAFFAWIAAVFWLFAIMMGNPDGTERRDDGRATVLGARNYMERYLLRALREQP